MMVTQTKIEVTTQATAILATTLAKLFGKALGAVALLGVLAMAVGSGAAQAQTDNSGASPAQRRACTPDVYRLCAGEIPSVSKITSCLRRKKASLSDACRAVFEQ